MPEKRLPAKIENLNSLIEFVAGHAREAGFAAGRIKEIELATEEVLVNIFNYAYPGRDGSVVVDCRAEDDAEFVIDISDNGRPFNSLSVSDPDLTSDLTDRDIGGLGVFFIKRMVDYTRYRREGNRNILTLIFFIKDR